jgi:hypothetical protein
VMLVPAVGVWNIRKNSTEAPALSCPTWQVTEWMLRLTGSLVRRSLGWPTQC